MLELFYKINSKVTAKVDGKNPQEVFDNLAVMQSVFSVDKCGCCQSEDLKFVVRKAQGEKNKVYNYYELWCNKCHARLSFGVSDDGQIYPKLKISQLAVEKSEADKKRADDNADYAGKHFGWLKDAGWYKYKPEIKTEDNKIG
jgi:hypothetical protein